jgi:dihydroorotate dehydrogenase
MYGLLRKILFQFDPETAHEWTIRSLQLLQKQSKLINPLRNHMQVHAPQLKVTLWNLEFPNPVGLAAGFDKHANVYPALSVLGFGFIEVGTLTPRPQEGNPRPRLFRLKEDQAIINRMGFNNHGIEAAKQSLSTLPRPPIPIGINLGKNKDTPNIHAVDDYIKGLETLYPFGDYFVINVSSPNTPGLRDLQQIESMKQLLTALQMKREQLMEQKGAYKPILLKIAPDLSLDDLQEIARMALILSLDGIIATNTTVAREGLSSPLKKESGGLSGKPLAQKATEWIKAIYQVTRGKIPIIGVGGIFTGEDAYAKIRAGASLVQVYTGMIYRGPAICKWINLELLQLLQRDGFQSISEAVGVDVK